MHEGHVTAALRDAWLMMHVMHTATCGRWDGLLVVHQWSVPRGGWGECMRCAGFRGTVQRGSWQGDSAVVVVRAVATTRACFGCPARCCSCCCCARCVVQPGPIQPDSPSNGIMCFRGILKQTDPTIQGPCPQHVFAARLPAMYAPVHRPRPGLYRQCRWKQGLSEKGGFQH